MYTQTGGATLITSYGFGNNYCATCDDGERTPPLCLCSYDTKPWDGGPDGECKSFTDGFIDY